MIPPLPSVFLSGTGVALSGQTNRQLMIKWVGGLLPGGQGLFKPIDRDSYAKVIKQLLVFAILGLEQRVMAFFFKYYYFYQLCDLKERVSRSARSAVHICRYFLLEFHQGFHLKCKRQPCPPDKRRTDTAAVDIVLYNAAAVSVRTFPQKIKFTFPRRRTWEEKQTFNSACNEKQCDNTPHSQHAQIKEMPPKTTSERKILETKWSLYSFCKMCFKCVFVSMSVCMSVFIATVLFTVWHL